MNFTNAVATEIREASPSGTAPKNSTQVAIVLPSLNEEKAISEVIDKINAVMEGYHHQIIVVDGCSVDRTAKIAEEKGAIVIQQRHKGYGDALYTGFKYADEKLGASITVMMDADGTYDPKDLTRLLTPIMREEAEITVGNRFKGMEKDAMDLRNRIGNKIISWTARKILKTKIYDTQSGFRAFNTKAFRNLDLKSEGMPLAIEMLAEARQAKSRVVEVPITYHRRIGKSKLSPFKDGFLILGVVLRLARDYQPLLFFGSAGAIFLAAGILFGVRVVIEFLATGEIVHLASVVLSSLLAITGIQLLFLALIADMIKSVKVRTRKE